MRLMLEEDLAHCTTLDELQSQVQATLRGLRDDGYSIGYVAGPISCDGETNIPANIEKLLAARTQVMRRLGNKSLVFTAPFILSLEPYHNSYARLRLFDMDPNDREADLQLFWDNLIRSGLIDTIYFAKGWERSPGSRRERRTALENGVQVSDI